MRKLNDIIAHIRAVAANPSVSTTLIQTEDLEALCTAAELGQDCWTIFDDRYNVIAHADGEYAGTRDTFAGED